MTAKRIRMAFWVLAVVLGGTQTWYTRHRIFSDGISYLELAQQYARGDLHGALNAYWSPLYSWVLAAYLKVARPSPYWQSSSLHVVNFLAFLGSCWIYEKFLGELIAARPAGTAGFSHRTLQIAGYVAILHGGLIMVGIGYVSPDMIAYFLTGVAAWLTMRIGRGEKQWAYLAALGAILGFGYLDRSAFAPLSAVYILGAAFLLVKTFRGAARGAILCGICLLVVAAPFALELSLKRGELTMGESGKLNYGWEVAGAARSVHWQGEPGDIGRPLHPTRVLLKSPVPVYEFGGPVEGSYPPWYDPSYWYQGIRPHLKWASQMKVLMMNARTTLLYMGTTPVFVILLLTVLVTRGKGLGLPNWPRAYWAVALPAVAGIAMYCLVFVDKRYIAGFFAVLWITMLAGAKIPTGRLGKYADVAAQVAAVAYLMSIVVYMRPAFLMAGRDVIARQETEHNVSWMMAHRMEELGVKPGDRIAFVGTGISADWVRLAGAKVVAEVPVSWSRGEILLNIVDQNEENPNKFFQLDDASREKVYDAFRSAGAVLAVANTSQGGRVGDWKPVLDPNEPGYPKSAGQVLLQSPGHYKWLNR